MTANNTYKRRKAAGVCVQCGAVAVSGVVRCRDCQDVNNRRIEDIRKGYQQQGLCFHCGDAKENANRAFCDTCTAKRNQRHAFRRLGRKVSV